MNSKLKSLGSQLLTHMTIINPTLVMKKAPIKLSIGAAALSLLAVASASAQTTLTTINDATITRAWEDATFSTAFSTIVGSNGNTFQVGNDMDAGDGGTKPAEWRSIMKFDISSLSGTVGTTTLTLTGNNSFGSPNDIFIDNIADNNTGIDGAAEFDAPTGGFLAISSGSSLSNGDVISLDVTSLVQADVNAGRSISTLRFYESSLNTNGTNPHVRIFQSSENPNGSFDPTLTVIPEPASGALLFGLGACAFMFARRRVK